MISELRRGPNQLRAVVKSKALAPFRDASKGNYLRLTLGDASGEIEGKIWDNAERIQSEIRPGEVYALIGNLEEWQGQKSLVIQSFEPVLVYDPREFLPGKGEIEMMEIKRGIHELIAEIRDPSLRSIANLFFDDPEFAEQFFLAPAGKTVHHAYLGGLAEHSLEVARAAKLLAGPKEKELAVLGALLHDIGKLKEYTYNTMIDLTTTGKLIGHLVLGYQMFMERVSQHPFLPEDLVLRLGHIILSHHGEKQWGAAVEPQTVEAAVVYYADLSTSKVARFQTLAAAAGPDGWSEKDKILDRAVWAG